MKIYAMVLDGAVTEIIEPLVDESGHEIPIDERFHPEIVAQLVEVSAVMPTPARGWTYKNGAFSAPVQPTADEFLATARANQIAALTESYQSAIQADVTFKTAGGVEKAFQADSESQDVLLVATTGYNLAGSTPTGFYWVASDNTQVPFTLDDLKGLYGVMLAQGNVAFKKLQTLKAAVRAATIEEVSTIVWA